MIVSLSVTFGLEKVGEARIDLEREFGSEGVEDNHGVLQFFGPRGRRRGFPAPAGGVQIIEQGGVEAELRRRKSHGLSLEKGSRGVECLSRRGQRFRNDGWQS